MLAGSIPSLPEARVDRNLLLAIVLSVAVLTLWGRFAAPPPEQTPPGGSPQVEQQVPPDRNASLPPESAPHPRGSKEARGAADRAPAIVQPVEEEERVHIRTQLFDAELTTRGGALLRWDLLRYDDPSVPGRPQVDLVTLDPEREVALATPFESLGLGDWSQAPWVLQQPDPLTVVFTREQNGIRVRKTYEFSRDQYLFRLRLEVENGSGQPVAPAFRVGWPAERRESTDYRDFGIGFYTDGSYEYKTLHTSRSFFGMGGGSFKEVLEVPKDIDWAGAVTRYFVAALLPDVPREAAVRVTPIVPGERAQLELAFQKAEVPPGRRVDHEYRVYLGPKEPDRLDAVGAHLEAAIRKGWFPSLTRFFTRLLTATYAVVPNYGVAIILLTIVVRLLMAPLMARQMRSMKRMSTLQPKIKELQARYPDDRQKQSEAMMSVYKEAGVNPLSTMTGCLPMFLQFPVFIGFYYALQGSIQPRQQPFVGWIDDLSAPETLFVLPGLEIPVRLLPLLMGASMFLQQKLSPSAMDQTQARMMMTVMPVMFTLMFYQFASGLVLYWLVSTLLGILQQVYTNRQSS